MTDEPNISVKPKVTSKPIWVEKYGNVSQIVSAACAILFGVSAAAISLQIASIQRHSATESDLARDRAAMAVVYEVQKRDQKYWSSAFHCGKLSLTYKDKDRATREFPARIEKTDFPSSIDTEINFAFCGESSYEQMYLKAHYAFEVLDRALILWESTLSDERKRVYKLEFAVFCQGPMTDFPRDSFFSDWYKKLASFTRECPVTTGSK